jgi:PEGA domain
MTPMFNRIAVLALLTTTGTLMGQGTDSAWLKTKVDPGRAGVFVDGKYLGPASNFGVGRKYALPAGEHKVRLVEPRYEDMETSVTLAAGKTVVLRETMKALPPPKGPFGVLRTIHPEKYAAVYVNDHYMGHADEFNNFAQGLKLPVGEYDVRIEPSSGSPIKQHVKIEADKTVIVK